MTRKFWRDFLTGASVGAAGIAGLWAMINRGERRIARLEKSIQIGRTVEEVFAAWTNLSLLPEYCGMIRSVRRVGDCSRWTATVDGRTVQWDAELVQIIPNQAIGWKSVSGPKHTGRVSFSPIGDDTLLHVKMNYVPPLRFAARWAPLEEKLTGFVDKALRDFKAALEAKRRESVTEESSAIASPGSAQATGTHGRASQLRRPQSEP